MSFSFIDGLAAELEFPTQRQWTWLFFTQTPRGCAIYEISTVFFTNQRNAKEAQRTRKGLCLCRQTPNRSRWNLKLRKRRTYSCHFWHVASDPFVEFVIIWNKWRHSFWAQCAHWHGTECFPLIMRQFNAECDPAWIFECCACFPYHQPSHTLPASFSVSLSLAFIAPSIVIFQEFPLGVAQVVKPKQMAGLSSLPVWASLSVSSLLKRSAATIFIRNKRVCLETSLLNFMPITRETWLPKTTCAPED